MISDNPLFSINARKANTSWIPATWQALLSPLSPAVKFRQEIIMEAVKRCAMDGGKWNDSYLFGAMPPQAQHDKITNEIALGEISIERCLRLNHPQTYTTESEVTATLDGTNHSSAAGRGV
jgi:hypothetical protein